MTRTRTIIAGAALALLLAAFLAGRLTAPRPAATKDTRAVAASSQSSASSASSAHVEAIAHESATGDVDTKTTATRKWFPAVPAKGGCPELPAHVEETTTTETHAATTRTADRKRASDLAAKRDEQTAAQQTVVETHTSVPVLPSWSFTGLVGVQRSSEKAFNIIGPVVGGVVVDHRFVGPVYLGGWAATFGGGAAGASVRLSF